MDNNINIDTGHIDGNINEEYIEVVRGGNEPSEEENERPEGTNG